MLLPFKSSGAALLKLLDFPQRMLCLGNAKIKLNDVKSPALYVQVGVTEGNREVRSLPYIKSWCR